MQAIRTHARVQVDRVRELITWPAFASRSWCAGFLAGIYDAEGSYSGGILRISNTDSEIIRRIGESLRTFDFKFVIEHVPRETSKPIDVVRVLGGLKEHLRFFHGVDPAISRKRDISGQAVKSAARLEVAFDRASAGARCASMTSPPELRISSPMAWSVTTATPVRRTPIWISRPASISRPRFSTRPMRRGCLSSSSRSRSYVVKPITIGANTDPYQPVERELRVTRRCWKCSNVHAIR